MATRTLKDNSTRKRLEEKIRSNTLYKARHIDAIKGPDQSQESLPIELPQFEVINFFEHYTAPRENYSPVHDEDVTSTKSSHQPLRESVTLEDVLSNFKNGHINFVGPAGSGKTTLLRSITRRAAEHSCPGLQDVQYVHFLEGGSLGYRGNLTATQLLLFDILSQMDRNETTEYGHVLSETPEKILIVLDSLDTFPFTLKDETKEIDLLDEVPVSTIVWNFLTGKICGGCRIITSSREHGIRDFTGKLRPSQVIALAGLTAASVEKISIEYLGEERAVETLKHLKETSPAVMKLCSTPVFLALTLHGIQTNEDFLPNSMTAVLCEVFCCLIRSSVARARNIEIVILKLAHFACDGIIAGRVVFDTTELAIYGLSEDDVVDLTTIAPRAGAQKLLRIENCLYFSHLCLQEMLSAHHISRSGLESFGWFLEKHIHNPRYCVIRRLLCGLLFDEDVLRITENTFGEIECLPEKRRMLKTSLEERLQQKCGPVDLLEQMITLNEGLPSLRDVVTTSLQEVVLHGIALSNSDAYVIGSVVSQSRSLTVFALIDCNLSAEFLKSVSSLLKRGVVEVYRFQVSDNKNMGTDGILQFAEISKSCSAKFLDLGNCALTPNLLNALSTGLHGVKVPQMLLRENKNMGKVGYTILGDIIHNCGVEKLGIGGCDPDAQEMRALRISSKGSILKTLVLSSILPHTPAQAEMSEVVDVVSSVSGELRLLGWDVSEENRNLLQQRMIESQPNLKIILDDDDILASTTLLHKKVHMPSARKIGVAKTDVRQIGPEGGVIKIGKCEVYFPPNAVTSITRFRISLGMHTRPLPDENVRISSLLTCQPSMKFPVPVKVKLPSWCRTTSSNVVANIMAQDSHEEEPYPIGSIPLKGTSGIIEFETYHFTGFWAFIKRMFFGELKFKVTPTLHFNASSANFSTAFHVSDQIIAEVCSKHLKDGGFQRCPVMLDTVTLKAGDLVGSVLCCLDPETCMFDSGDRKNFRVEEDFASDSAKHVAFILSPRPQPGQELILLCRIDPYETTGKRFRLVWPSEDDGPQDGGVHIYGNVHAGTIVL